ncbi:Tyrosine-protein kinase transmembrane receptor Ror [Gryllus bimaculatus]|nr:Tyrosine-protein kinase transmembrane receptor Ror [Gryllus bimaculatus]
MSNCYVSVLCVMVLAVIVTSNELINGTTTLEFPTTESDRMEIIKTPSDRTETDTIASAETDATTTVYIDSSDDSGVCQKMLEDKLTNAFTVIAHSQDLSASCEAFAKPSLCYSAFPLCHEDDLEGEQGPRKICREDCEILENEMCSTEYAIAKRHPLIGKQLVLHECDELPPIGSKESKGCLKLGIPRPENVDSSHTCYRDKGQTYRGTVSVTATGLLCTPWSQQLIHKASDHPELVGGHSFCRNPGNTENQPWCFTVQNKKELCDIPKCDFNIWVYAVAAAISATLLVGPFGIYWCCFRQRKNANVHLSQPLNSAGNKICVLKTQHSSPSKSTSKGSQVVEMHLLLPDSSNKKGERVSSGVRAREYQLANVKFLQELGEGAFGKVYKGEVNTGEPGEPLQVAIKTLKENATPKTQADFRREVELMTDLRHNNIVCLLGVVMKGEPLCMLFEYMTEGDLHEFLISHSPRADVAGSDEGSHVLGQSEFLHIALQIATGMEYLSSHHYVHRDLAARNCLVGDNLTVKISDFGLSRDIYSSDYYRVQSKSLLPVRWMPPESILYGKFTTESDVWSFGVVLWEIYSYGLQPYYGYSNQEVIDMIRSRQLLPCPEDCPSGLYSLMIECWHEIPNRRPQFPEINSRLRSWWSNLPNKECDDKLSVPTNASERIVASTSCFNPCPTTTVLHTGSLPSNYLQQHAPMQHIQNQIHSSQMSNSHHVLPGYYQFQGSKPVAMYQRHGNRAKTYSAGVSNSPIHHQGHTSFGTTVPMPAQLIVRLPSQYNRSSNGIESKISNI